MIKTRNTIQTKKSFYFSHDSNARNDEKIVHLRMKHGAEGYGIYFMLIEMLMESTDYRLYTNYLALAFHLHSNEELVQSVVEDFNLFGFDEDSETFYSPSLNQRIAPLEQIREKRRQAGIRSGQARRAKQEQNKEQKLLKATACDATQAEISDSLVESASVKKEDLESVKASVLEEFTAPSFHDVSSYCIDNKLNVDIELFLDFYQSKGWMIGQNEMKDWKAAVRNWHRQSHNQLDMRRRSSFKSHKVNIANYKNNRIYEKF